MRMAEWGIVAAGVLALSALGCTTVLPWDQPPPPADVIQGGERQQPELTVEQARMEHRVLVAPTPPSEPVAP